MPTLPINAPAGYVPPLALAFADDAAKAVVVDPSHPLPVATAEPGAATSTPLAGSTSESTVAGPFAPQLGRPVWLALSGAWAGTVTLQRSTDGGATRFALTVGGEAWAAFTGNVCEPVAEESEHGATYYLDVALASGTLVYRVAQ